MRMIWGSRPVLLPRRNGVISNFRVFQIRESQKLAGRPAPPRPKTYAIGDKSAGILRMTWDGRRAQKPKNGPTGKPRNGKAATSGVIMLMISGHDPAHPATAIPEALHDPARLPLSPPPVRCLASPHV